MAVLVLLESAAGAITQPSRCALSAAATLAGAAGTDLHALLAGDDIAAATARAALLPGIARVLGAESPVLAQLLAEPTAALLAALAPGYSHIVAAATTNGKNIIPRLAGLLDVQPITEVTAIIDAATFVRPIYAGNALATVVSDDAIRLLTIRAASFPPADAPPAGAAAPVEMVALPADLPSPSRFVAETLTESARPELVSARVVISGGRGMGSKEAFALLEPIADHLAAAIGASRAAVDAGFVGNDQQVGQTGKIIAPDLYIAVGISGALQHLAGMKDSKVIVAINKDEEAPIFQVADYGLTADLFIALPELAAELEHSE